jgi:hypothetical protein
VDEALFRHVLALRFSVELPFIVSISIHSFPVNVRSARLKGEKFFWLCFKGDLSRMYALYSPIHAFMAHPKGHRAYFLEKVSYSKGAPV